MKAARSAGAMKAPLLVGPEKGWMLLFLVASTCAVPHHHLPSSGGRRRRRRRGSRSDEEGRRTVISRVHSRAEEGCEVNTHTHTLAARVTCCCRWLCCFVAVAAPLPPPPPLLLCCCRCSAPSNDADAHAHSDTPTRQVTTQDTAAGECSGDDGSCERQALFPSSSSSSSLARSIAAAPQWHREEKAKEERKDAEERRPGTMKGDRCRRCSPIRLCPSPRAAADVRVSSSFSVRIRDFPFFFFPPSISLFFHLPFLVSPCAVVPMSSFPSSSLPPLRFVPHQKRKRIETKKRKSIGSKARERKE